MVAAAGWKGGKGKSKHGNKGKGKMRKGNGKPGNNGKGKSKQPLDEESIRGIVREAKKP